jgi:hypothetical protein
MLFPFLPLLAGAAIGKTSKKTPKKTAVSKYTKKNGNKVKAYTRKAN